MGTISLVVVVVVVVECLDYVSGLDLCLSSICVSVQCVHHFVLVQSRTRKGRR